MDGSISRKKGKRPSAKQNATFLSVFELAPSERLLEEFPCALLRDVPVHGKLQMSQHYVCFHAVVFGWVTIAIIPFTDVVAIEKKSGALVFTDPLCIETKTEAYVFGSFVNRDKTAVKTRFLWLNAVSPTPKRVEELYEMTDAEMDERLLVTAADVKSPAASISSKASPSTSSKTHHVSEPVVDTLSKEEANSTSGSPAGASPSTSTASTAAASATPNHEGSAQGKDERMSAEKTLIHASVQTDEALTVSSSIRSPEPSARHSFPQADVKASLSFEVCVESVESALAAQAGGANRIELCSSLLEGGLTPSMGLLAAVCQAVTVGVMVMVRPRGGDFVYSAVEKDIVLADIRMICGGPYRVQGIVVGALTAEGKVDSAFMKDCILAAGDKEITFHRAFDLSVNMDEALEDIVALGGIQRILSSGGDKSALEGSPVLARLVSSAGGRVTMVAGAGISKKNIKRIVEETGVSEVHFSGRSPVESPAIFRNTSVVMGGAGSQSSYERLVTTVDNVRAIIEACGSTT